MQRIRSGGGHGNKQPGFHQISQDEAKEMMAKDDGHVVVNTTWSGDVVTD